MSLWIRVLRVQWPTSDYEGCVRRYEFYVHPLEWDVLPIRLHRGSEWRWLCVTIRWGTYYQ